jgi:prolyl oligopeptidase
MPFQKVEDWRKVIIMDAITNKIEDTIVDVSGVSWKANEGFYYSSYDKGSELSAKKPT